MNETHARSGPAELQATYRSVTSGVVITFQLKRAESTCIAVGKAGQRVRGLAQEATPWSVRSLTRLDPRVAAMIGA
jgi:hypothetical protein